MKMLALGSIISLVLLISCSDGGRPNTAESDVDAARNFIRASLDNDFKTARNYLLRDSANEEYLDNSQRSRAKLGRDENLSYRESSIRIHETKTLNDSTSIIFYSNSYKNQKNALKLLRIKGQWLVDLKYSFAPTDSIQ